MSAAAVVAAKALRVLVIDDSAVVRRLLCASLRAAGMHVESVADPILAQQKMRTWVPDVIVLDLEMPRMDGLTYLRVLRTERAIPVVVCSGATGARSGIAMRALEEGAVDIVARPRFGTAADFEDALTMLRDAVQGAAHARPRRASAAAAAARPSPMPVLRARQSSRVEHRLADRRIVAIGASTGGVEALRAVIVDLPVDAPPIVVVQHMPEGFTAAFAARLDDEARVTVKEATTGDLLAAGTVLIAPGGRHLSVVAGPNGPCAEVLRGALVARHRPSVDVLFHSVAAIAGRHATGVLLTGMGEDGRDGMRALRAAGGRTLAQDEASCVVFGMPKAAIEAGVVDEIVPLHRMTATMLGAAY